jgi:nitroreductase
MGEAMDVLMARRSVGKVLDEPPSRDVIEQLLLAAVHAPNHHLTEPWRFIVLTGPARRTVGEAHAAATRRTRPDAGSEALAREISRMERAPVVIVCCLRTDPSDVVRAREDRDAVAAAIQNLLLAAHDHGLGGMWRTGTMVDEPEVRQVLGLDDADAIVGFVYLGPPAVAPSARPRRPLTDVVEWRTT